MVLFRPELVFAFLKLSVLLLAKVSQNYQPKIATIKKIKINDQKLTIIN